MSGRGLGGLRPSARESPLPTRLGRKLLGWLLFLSLAPLLLSNMLGYVESQRIIESLVKRNLVAVAVAMEQHVRDQVSRAILRLETTANANQIIAEIAASSRSGPASVTDQGNALGADVSSYLERSLEELWEFDALYLRAADGAIVAAAGEVDGLAEELVEGRAEELWSGSGSGGGEGLSTWTSTGQARFHFRTPVHDDAFRIVGHIGAVMSRRGLEDLLEIPPHLAGSIESFVVDEGGRPLFVSHAHGPPRPDSPLATPVLGEEPLTFLRYADRQGVEVFGLAVPIEGVSWHYITEFPVEAALGPLYLLRRVSIIFGTALAIVLVVTAWFVAGGIVAPVRRLVTAARRVGKGDLAVRVESTGNDEIGELARAFNEMTGDLAEARAHVDELHRQEIERAQQLATVGELASGVAHEIKNPVVGISNGLDLVRRRIGDEGSLGPIMDEMSRQLVRIEMAVRDLLSFARPATPEPVPADVSQIVERAARLIEPAADRARVSVVVETDPTLPRVRGDPELLGQALVNLLMNAVQATSSGGRITISASVDAVTKMVSFRVADTGRGISEEERSEIFKPFYTTRHSGSGLGLSISREIVERHDGRIEVESEVGRGSVFIMTIPIAAEDLPARREATG